MPLGKLSRKQLEEAFIVLLKAASWLSKFSDRAKTEIEFCTNKFFSLVPHNLGNNPRPLLDNIEIIKVIL